MAELNAIRIGKKLGMGSVIALAAFGTVAALGVASAHADEIRPTPGVQSGQADSIGIIKGDATYGDVRGADIGEVHAHGDVRDSMIAVPGRTKGKKWRYGTWGMPNSFR
ncbi:hypothetical protein CRI77_15245 [Mycolicibacterium duvalii]|uniref:Uncharacterized protein n=1 Tax=Mycolicibacterium duvalii TaxID=39688 RepID=A0A7I7K388_9MYCO|nr:hypothetical protein [Mycolicibacterium duvalii]MCV7370601.1 hypothetical protein [Mycolicibacterium duvalii]PEG39888.1 hypothetical protein CRI77_15245 [Mycolicibacterium duvalii]BBX18018.1 hypothetical protein MDUV_28780 [Mycolicibacterium duvalii]